MQVRFNPASSVKFDVGAGVVSRADGDRVMLTSAQAVVGLCASAGPDATRDFGRSLGTELGRRVADRFAGGAAKATLEEVLEHLGGELALMGLGSLGLERWGKALVLTVSGTVEKSGVAPDATLLGAVLEGAIQRIFGRDVRAAELNRDGNDQRLLVAREETTGRAVKLLTDGVPWGEVLTRLHAKEGV